MTTDRESDGAHGGDADRSTSDEPSTTAPPARSAGSRRRAQAAHGLIGTAVGAYAFLDDLFVGPIVVALAAWLPWFVTLVVAALLLTVVNVVCCNWLQRSWDAWIHGHGAKLEARIAKLRSRRLLRYPADWMMRDSIVWFTIAAGLIGAVIIVAATHLISGETVPRRRVRFASLAYSAGFAATYAIIGLGLGDLVRAL
jgi:hypothetical protein